MLKQIVSHLFNKEQKIPEYYLRMVRSEYKNVPIEYVQAFLEQHNRLPSPEELQYAI